MIGLLVALAVTLGIGGTAVIADNAHPGDTLFGVDQAVERLRINIARKEAKDELRVKFAEERISELEDLDDDSDNNNTDTPDDSADDSTDDSAPKKELSDEDKARIETGIAAALTLLAQVEPGAVDAERLAAVTALLNGYLLNLSEEAKININDERFKIKIEDESDDMNDESDDSNDDNRKIKIEQRTDEGRIRVEIKDGSVEIKTKLDDSKDDNDGNDDDNEHQGLGDIEAKIYNDKTVVEIELNDEKTTFVTTATTTEGIIAAIMAKFPELKQADIASALEMENEDENEREDENKSEDSNDDSNNDDGGDDNKDTNDDNSGSGKNN